MGKFWLVLQEPRRVPERKGPWPSTMTAQILREFIAYRPTAYIHVLTVSEDGVPDVQHGPELLTMLDGTGQRADADDLAVPRAHQLAHDRAGLCEVQPVIHAGCEHGHGVLAYIGTQGRIAGTSENGGILRWAVGVTIPGPSRCKLGVYLTIHAFFAQPQADFLTLCRFRSIYVPSGCTCVHIGPTGVASAKPGLTTTRKDRDMAANCPKPILPMLEGRIGELRKMRFWSKVDTRSTNECWEWQASCFGSGYGRFRIASHVIASANRVALVIYSEEDRLDLFALHQCDNPKCCNPHHLYWGTHADNMKDMIARNRRKPVVRSGASNGAAKLTAELHAVIVDRLKRGWSNTFIAMHLPISHSQVSAIRCGKAWAEQSRALGWEPKAQFRRNAA